MHLQDIVGRGSWTEIRSLWQLMANYEIVEFIALTLTYLGGGAIMAPPCRFFNGASIPLKISHSSFMTFFFQVSRTFWHQICDARGYGSEVT